MEVLEADGEVQRSVRMGYGSPVAVRRNRQAADVRTFAMLANPKKHRGWMPGDGSRIRRAALAYTVARSSSSHFSEAHYLRAPIGASLYGVLCQAEVFTGLRDTY